MATGEYEEVQGVSSSLKSLIRAMIEPNPSLRIDIEDIHSHVWVRSQNYTFHTSSPMQWNNERLQQLEGMFALSREELKSRITKAFGPERVYYFLSDKKKSTGPLHLSFAFFSLRAAQTEANRKFPDANWTSPVTAETSSQLLVIKSQNGIYSLCLE
jgi:serine/threonine protein kinase